MGWLKEAIPEDLARMLKGGIFWAIPTLSGWTEAKAGGGGSAVEQVVGYNAVNTSATASSSDLLRVAFQFLGNTGVANPGYILWSKRLYFYFFINRTGSDAQAVGRVQLKEVNTIGALGAKGIGLRVDNLALVGESYGSQLGELDLATTLTAGYAYGILIVHDPATPKIEWYVDSGSGLVLVGTQSTSAKIPQTVGGAAGWIMNSIINGVGGGTDCYNVLYRPTIWQKR